MSKGIVIAAVGLAALGVIFLARKAVAEPSCFIAMPWTHHYVEYFGSDKQFQDIFTPEAWAVIHTYEIYDPVYGWQQIDAYDFVMQTGQYGRLMFHEAVEVCGFREV